MQGSQEITANRCTMVRRLFILLLSSVVLTAFPTLAANVVSVGGGTGSPGEEVEITVSLATDAADVAAAEIRIPMPAGMTPVEAPASSPATGLPHIP